MKHTKHSKYINLIQLEFLNMLKDYEKYINQAIHDEKLLTIKHDTLIKAVSMIAIIDRSNDYPSNFDNVILKSQSSIKYELRAIYWTIYDANYNE